MNKYIKTWKDIKKVFGIKEVLDALFGSLLYALLVLTPSVLIFMQVVSMYYHLLSLWVILLVIVIILISALQLKLWQKALDLKKPDHELPLNRVFNLQIIIHGIIIIIIGLLFLIFFIPMMQI